VREKYAAFAASPGGQFSYPIGRESAISLGYDRGIVGGIPDAIADRFVGVGNPLAHAGVKPGDRVLDLGCGCGFDCLVAAAVVGEHGSVVGIDVTREMLELGRSAIRDAGIRGIELVQGSAEMLPFADGMFDAVVSNGVINLCPDKDAVFGQVFRVLRPGGVFALADLLLDEGAGPVADDPASWAT
jgi:SAM-dependent methyltransferase